MSVRADPVVSDVTAFGLSHRCVGGQQNRQLRCAAWALTCHVLLAHDTAFVTHGRRRGVAARTCTSAASTCSAHSRRRVPASTSSKRCCTSPNMWTRRMGRGAAFRSSRIAECGRTRSALQWRDSCMHDSPLATSKYSYSYSRCDTCCDVISCPNNVQSQYEKAALASPPPPPKG